MMLVLAFVATVVLVRSQSGSTTAKQPRMIQAGDSVSSPEIDWKAHKATLVLALQVGCRFCAESSAFYEKMAHRLQGSGAHLAAIFPGPVPEALAYLAAMNVPVVDVQQASLASAKIYGTPTLILVDRTGRVTRTWLGKLKADAEEDVVTSVMALAGQ